MLRGIERARRLQDKRKEKANSEGSPFDLASKVNADLDKLEAAIFSPASYSSNSKGLNHRSTRQVARDANARLDKLSLAAVGEAEPGDSRRLTQLRVIENT